jgi:hypothetical protein
MPGRVAQLGAPAEDSQIDQEKARRAIISPGEWAGIALLRDPSARGCNHLGIGFLGRFWSGYWQRSNNQTRRCCSSLLQVGDGHLESARVVASQDKKGLAFRMQHAADTLPEAVGVDL